MWGNHWPGGDATSRVKGHSDPETVFPFFFYSVSVLDTGKYDE